MKKNKKVIIFLTIAIILSILAFILIYSFLTPQRTTFYIFKDNYEAGTLITSDMLTPIQADNRIVMAGSETASASYFITSETFSSLVKQGDVLKVDVSKGTPLTISTLTSSANNSIEVRMDPSSVAVTIPVTNTTGVSADIKPESHINLFVTYNSGGTYLLLENARVLSVAKDGAKISGMTIELDNYSALKVIDAVNTGKIYCGLVNGNGYIYEETEVGN